MAWSGTIRGRAGTSRAAAISTATASPILWQNENGMAAIWQMDGLSKITDGVVGHNPGPSWHVEGSGDFNGDSKSDPVAERERDGCDLADGWLEQDHGCRGRAQSRAELARRGQRGLQRRRQVR